MFSVIPGHLSLVTLWKEWKQTLRSTCTVYSPLLINEQERQATETLMKEANFLDKLLFSNTYFNYNYVIPIACDKIY